MPFLLGIDATWVFMELIELMELIEFMLMEFIELIGLTAKRGEDAWWLESKGTSVG